MAWNITLCLRILNTIPNIFIAIVYLFLRDNKSKNIIIPFYDSGTKAQKNWAIYLKSQRTEESWVSISVLFSSHQKDDLKMWIPLIQEPEQVASLSPFLIFRFVWYLGKKIILANIQQIFIWCLLHGKSYQTWDYSGAEGRLE